MYHIHLKKANIFTKMMKIFIYTVVNVALQEKILYNLPKITEGGNAYEDKNQKYGL